MRITGGVWRSRRLRGPSRTARLRPTPDSMRERAFAVLGDRVPGARVLDLFAGTGAVGLEALSRGAQGVVFVDRHRTATALVRSNLEALSVDPDLARVIQRSALDAVDALAHTGRTFDLVWADPPFESWTDGLAALVAVVDTGLASPDVTLCLECPVGADLAAVRERFEVERDLTGGASRVLLLRPRSK